MIAISGFSWAVAQWAPFSLVTNFFTPYNYREVDHTSQLATEILTDAPEDDGTTIRLSDTRSNSHRNLDVDADTNERNVFLPGEASESEEDDSYSGDEAERKEERRTVLGNSAAQVSRIDISSVSNGDGYPMTSGDETAHGVMRDSQSGVSLSAKAGIILVRDKNIYNDTYTTDTLLQPTGNP